MRRLLDDRRAGLWAVAGITLVGTVLRLLMARQDLFADELSTYWVAADRPAGDVVATVTSTAEISPPLSFLLSWAALHLGDTAIFLRLPSLLAGIASIPLVYLVGRRTVGAGAALVAATLTALSPFMIFYSAEARGYGVLMALVLVSTLALLHAVDDGDWGWWALYAAATLLAAYTHYTAVYVLIGQVGWALWRHAAARRPLLVATALAAVGFLPWLPSLRGDLDSPTTLILDRLSPIDATTIRTVLGQWSVGFPAANFGLPLPWAISGSSLRELPGPPALVLLGTSLAVAVAGVVATRTRWAPRVDLVLLLAVITPLGSLLQSLLSSNVFRARTLAVSWPYLALSFAALLAAGPRRARVVASALAVGAFGWAAVTLLQPAFQRPDHGRLAEVAEQGSGGVIVNAAAYTPGPLTTFDVPGSRPRLEVLRLTVPAQMQAPFDLAQPRPDPVEVARQAVRGAEGGPITLLTYEAPSPAVDAFLAALPAEYELSRTVVVPGIFDVSARVFERSSHHDDGTVARPVPRPK